MKNDKIKILFITARADFGGGPEHLYKLSKSLSEKYEPYFACPEDYPYFNKYLEICGSGKIMKIPHREFSFAVLFRLWDFLLKNKIDFIHSHGKGAGIYSRILTLISGKKTIHTFHGLHIGSYNKLQKWLYLFLEKLFSIITSRIIAVSYGEREEILQNRICTIKKLKVVENGVEIPEEKIKNEISSQKTLRIISFTRYDYQKYTEMLIDIALELKSALAGRKFEIKLLGEGQRKTEIEKKAAASGLNEQIIFKGAVTNPKEYLLESDLYLSTSRWEGLPLALLEAMSVGLPVIATNVVGNNDVVKDSINGYLFELDSPKSAADAILKLIKDYDLYSLISRNARELIIKNFSVESMVKKTENLYNSVVK